MTSNDQKRQQRTLRTRHNMICKSVASSHDGCVPRSDMFAASCRPWLQKSDFFFSFLFYHTDFFFFFFFFFGLLLF